MSAHGKLLLALGLEREERERFAAALQTADTTVEHCALWSDGLAWIGSRAYDLIVARVPSPGASLGELVRAARDPRGRCSGAGIVILADAERLREAAGFVGRGVNKALSLLESPEVVGCVLMRLASAAAPLNERLQVGLEIEGQSGGSWRRWRTENLSASGFLVSTRDEVRVGQAIPFRLRLPAGRGIVEGEGKVVRLTIPGYETAHGFGARFVSFGGDGRIRLLAYLESLRPHRPA